MLRLPHRHQRLIAAPFAVLGLVALFHLARGPQAGRDPEALLAHLRQRGVAVRVLASHSTLAPESSYEEVEGRIHPLELDRYRAELHQLRDVPRAMSFYRAQQPGVDTSMEALLGLPTKPLKWYRCDNYVLSIDAPVEEADRIGRIFERW
jgi:hypothetical protein